MTITPRNAAGYYTVDGKPYVSVTTALSVIRLPGLERWRGEVGNAEADARRDAAGDLGSYVHGIIAEMREADGVERPEVDAMLRAYREWRDAAVAEVFAHEQTVHHGAYQYAGTFDLLVEMRDSTFAIVDVKTGQRSITDPLQLAAYAEATPWWEEGLDASRDLRRLVLRLGKGVDAGKWSVEEYADPADFRRFLYALDLWRWTQEAKT